MKKEETANTRGKTDTPEIRKSESGQHRESYIPQADSSGNTPVAKDPSITRDQLADPSATPGEKEIPSALPGAEDDSADTAARGAAAGTRGASSASEGLKGDSA